MPSSTLNARPSARAAIPERSLLVVSLLLPLLLFGLAAWKDYREVLRASEQSVERTVRILQEHAVKVFETHRLVIEQVNERIRFMDWSREEDRTDLHRMLRGLQDTLPQIATITVTDGEGRLRASSRIDPIDPSVSFTDRDWFQALKDDPAPRIFVSRAYRGRQSDQSVFNVAGRITSLDGRFAGIVAVSVDRGYFQDFYRQIEADPTHTIVLAREDGMILARDPDTDQVMLNAEGGFASWMRAGSPTRVVAAKAARDGVERVYGFRRVGDRPVYVGYGLARSTALAPWWDSLRLYGLVAVLATLALLAASALAIRQSRRETAAMLRLEEARAELATANEHLEATVAERTARLQDSNEELQRYAYIVSHDLRAPLVNIIGFTRELADLKSDLLNAGALPPDAPARQQTVTEFDEAVGFITAGIGKMEGLIGAILKLSREGTRSFLPERLAMTPLLQGLADAQRHQANEASATVEIGLLPDIVADRVAVEQIFGNLIDNALKYLDPTRPGLIRVVGTATGRKAVFSVEDNGRGIAKGDHSRVFDLFRRSGAQDKPGEGIGLAHVRALLRTMGGRIDLQSEVGNGTRFTVILPLTPQPARADVQQGRGAV